MGGRNPTGNYRVGQALAGLGCGSIAAIFVVIGLASAAGGSGEVAQATKYREPVRLTYDEFVKQHPTEGWYHLTETALDVPGSHWKTLVSKRYKTETITEILVPVTSAVKDEDKPQIHLVLSTTDESIKNAITGLNAIPESDPKEKTLKYILDHAKELYPERDIEGMVKPISEIDEEQRRSLEESGLTGDAVLLKEGEKPSEGSGRSLQGFGTFMLIIAGLAALIGLWFIVQMQKDLKQIRG